MGRQIVVFGVNFLCGPICGTNFLTIFYGLHFLFYVHMITKLTIGLYQTFITADNPLNGVLNDQHLIDCVH